MTPHLLIEHLIMPRKGIRQKHTAGELAAKLAAQKPQGGGNQGIDARKPKTALKCLLCKADIHNLSVMRQHYEAKHPKETLNEADYAPK